MNNKWQLVLDLWREATLIGWSSNITTRYGDLGICGTLYTLYWRAEITHDEQVAMLHQLWQHRPEHSGAFWWTLDEDGKQARITVLEKLVKAESKQSEASTA